MKDQRGGEGLRSIFYLLLTSLVPFPEPNFPPRLIYRVTNGLPRQLYSRVAVTPLASSTARPPTRFIFRERERERSQRPSDRSASLNPPPPRAREDGRGSWGTFSSVELGRIGSGNGPLNLREAEGRFRIHGLFLESCINSTFVERGHISEIVRSGRLSRADTRHTKRGRKREEESGFSLFLPLCSILCSSFIRTRRNHSTSLAEYRISETIARSVGKITPINRCFLPTMQLRREEN